MIKALQQVEAKLQKPPCRHSQVDSKLSAVHSIRSLFCSTKCRCKVCIIAEPLVSITHKHHSPALVCISKISQGSISEGVKLDACSFSFFWCDKAQFAFGFAPESLDFYVREGSRLSAWEEAVVLR